MAHILRNQLQIRSGQGTKVPRTTHQSSTQTITEGGEVRGTLVP